MNGGHDDDVIIIKTSTANEAIVLTAKVGGVDGYLLCDFIPKDEAAERGINTEGQVAILEPNDTQQRVV